MEKLLRCCDIATIYVLIRSKKGKNAEFRSEEIFEDVVFDKLKIDQPKFRHKIVGIAGDCQLPGLGISAANRKTLQQNVNVIFHVAATVRFDEKLKLALGINVNGTREIMLMLPEIENLKVIIFLDFFLFV